MTSAEPSLRWLSMNAVGMDVTISEVTEQMAALSLQGPKSRAVLNRCCAEPLDRLKYFRLMHTSIGNIPVSISRTGYTGDLGYEIWMEAEHALPVWDALMEAGDDYGITPCGILAMDMARVEAGLFMIDVDYTRSNHAWIAGQQSTPFELGLDWAVNLDKKGYFVGRRALEREKRDGSSWKLVGIEIEWEGLEKLFADVGLPPQIPAHGGARKLAGDARGQAGRLRLDQHLVAAVEEIHCPGPSAAPVLRRRGPLLTMEVTVEHHRRQAPGKVVKLPFYEPAWKKK